MGRALDPGSRRAPPERLSAGPGRGRLLSGREAEAAATLARLGLDAGALVAADTPPARLAPLLAGPDGTALVDALGRLEAAPVARLLVALEPLAPTRDLRRAIRRALYRLRQRGVGGAETPPARPAPGTRPPESALEGLVSLVDGRGDRLVWLWRALPAGGLVLVAAQVNEPAGLVDVQVAEVSRKQLRAARQQLERDAGVRLVPADGRALDALLVEAHGRVDDAGRERVRDYLRVRSRLTADPPAAVPLRSPRALPPPADEASALVAGSAALLGEPEFRTWWPGTEAVAPVLEEIAAARESPLVVSRAAQEDRLREILTRAATTLVPPDVFARRLEATAYVLAETGRIQPARQALAVAEALRHPGGAPVPFAVAYVERAVGALLAETAQRETEARRDSLVVTPGEHLRDRTSSHPPRTRG